MIKVEEQSMHSIMIVDDHVLFREGLRNIIGHWDDFKVIGEASNGREALELARELLPDVVLMDITMPVLNGIETTAKMSRELPGVKIVILTMSEEEEDLFEAIKSGASGYVLKDTPSRRLKDQIRGVIEGEAPLSGLMASKIMKEFQTPRTREASPCAAISEPLTNREGEVLELVVQGLTNPEIGEQLVISENTVKKHLHNILEKFHLNNRVEAAMYAVREGLVKQ
jgi:DNA-binding NarL/FixJ family response regulator